MCSEHPEGISETDINLMLAKVKQSWLKHPHLRLGQLLLNAMLRDNKGKYDMYTFYYIDNSKLFGALSDY
jgi:hypothetical protein